MSAGWVFAAISAISCGRTEFPRQTPSEVAAEHVTAEDKAVYDAIVTGYGADGLLLGTCFDFPSDDAHPLSPNDIREHSSQLQIYLVPFTQPFEWTYSMTRGTWLVSGTGKRTQAELLVPHSAFESLKSRNRRRASLDGYRPRDLSVITSNNEARTSTLAFTRPGYSLGGGEALVSIFCTPHNPIPYVGTSGEYIYLHRRNGAWRVVAHTPMWIQ